MSTYPTLSQFQEFGRKVSKMEGQGLYFQKSLFEFIQSKTEFSSLFSVETEVGLKFLSLPQQDKELTKEQFESLKENLPLIIFIAQEYLAENENRKTLEMSMMGETQEEYSKRITMETMDNFNNLSSKMDDDLKKLGINWQ